MTLSINNIYEVGDTVKVFRNDILKDDNENKPYNVVSTEVFDVIEKIIVHIFNNRIEFNYVLNKYGNRDETAIIKKVL